MAFSGGMKNMHFADPEMFPSEFSIDVLDTDIIINKYFDSVSGCLQAEQAIDLIHGVSARVLLVHKDLRKYAPWCSPRLRKLEF